MVPYPRRVEPSDELTRDRSAKSLEAANHEVYSLLKEGIEVSVPETESRPHPGPMASQARHKSVAPSEMIASRTVVPGRGGEGIKSGGQKTEGLRVVDWEHPANNDSLLVVQFSVTGAWAMANDESRLTN